MAKNKSHAAKCYHEFLASQPCALCMELGIEQTSPTEVHHIRAGQGMSQRAGHFLALPLSYEAHRGPQGIHGDRSLWRISGHDELSLLDKVIERVYSQM
jgi:hypothetical protein